LFQYISGTNEEDLKVEMTAPVKVQVVPGAGPYCKSNFKISFFVPLELQVRSHFHAIQWRPLPFPKKVSFKKYGMFSFLHSALLLLV
jgi:hypothetical protein